MRAEPPGGRETAPQIPHKTAISTTALSPGRPGGPPPECDRILIVGAGGLGRELLHWARDAWPSHASRIAGFLSDDPARLDDFDVGVPIVASPVDYVPRPGDRLILGIGIQHVRRAVATALEARGATFLTLVHPTATVAPTAHIGTGAVVCPGTIVSCSARLGRFVLVNYLASLAHDSVAGDFSVLSPYAALGGNASIGDDAFLGIHATVAPNRRVGSGGKVSAGSAVLADVPPESLAYGVPSRVAPLIAVASE